jgi:hypothetical protein
MHVLEFVFCNIYHVLEQMSECQKPRMILIFDCTVHHYFIACTGLVFLSCFVAVTTELTCYLNVHAASHVHIHIFIMAVSGTQDSTQLHRYTQHSCFPCTALMSFMTAVPCHSKLPECLGCDANDDSMFSWRYKNKNWEIGIAEDLRQTHIPIHPFPFLPTPHSVQQQYSTNSKHVKLQLSTFLLLFMHCLLIISMNNWIIRSSLCATYKDLKPNLVV